MPALSALEIPKPKNWQDFESLSLSSFKIRWQNPNLVKNGRQGQPQAGVDIYGDDHLGLPVGVQCKETERLEFSVVEEEVAKAETFIPGLKIFYFATTAETDAVVQNKIRVLSHERVTKAKFAVGVFFWEDVISELSKNKAEFAYHYPEFQLVGTLPQVSGARKPSILDLAYYGPHVDAYMDLLFGEVGQMSNANPYDMQRLLLSVETACTILFDHKRSERLISDARSIWGFIETYAIKGENKAGGWSQIMATVKRLENSITASDNLFVGQELGIFKLGQLLGTWDIKTADGFEFTANSAIRLRELFGSLQPSPSDVAEFEALLAKYFLDPESFSNVGVPFDIYNAVRRQVTRAEIAN